LGHTVVASESSGRVLVKPDGESEFEPLEDAAELPVNSTIDASNGSVVLRTALGGGDSQRGTFRGGTFEVRQARHSGGMTTLALRGSMPTCGNTPAAGSERLLRGDGNKRRLWGKDHGGRFKTAGKGSVATVRGTSWYMADRCDGTITRVSSGHVLVRERGTGRHKLLSRGESFLAHYPH
jgi:ribosomal protein L27